MSKEKPRLNLNLDSLLPGESLPIGNTTVIIRPLGLLQIKFITKRISTIFSSFKEKGITFSTTRQEFPDVDNPGKMAVYAIPPNYREPDHLVTIAETLVADFPDVLSEVSGIHMDDLDILPLETIVSIIDKCLDVNLKSKESLMGNWQSLTEKLEKMNLLQKPKKAEEKPGQETPKQ